MNRGMYIKNKAAAEYDEEWYVAWPLHSPQNPQYADWSWVRLCRNSHTQYVQAVFVRGLTTEEVKYVLSRYMVWGEKLPNESWALVAALSGGEHYGTVGTAAPRDPLLSVGV